VKNERKGFYVYPDSELGSLPLQRLKDDQFGKYWRLRLQCWADKGLPKNHDRLAWMLGCSREEFDAFWQCVAPLFCEISIETIWDADLWAKYNAHDKRSDTSKVNGRSGGRPKKLTNPNETGENLTKPNETYPRTGGNGNGIGKGRGKGKGVGITSDPTAIRLGQRYAEIRAKRAGIRVDNSAVQSFSRMMLSLLAGEGTEAAIDRVLDFLAEPAGDHSWSFNLGALPNPSYTHPFVRNFATICNEANGSGRNSRSAAPSKITNSSPITGPPQRTDAELEQIRLETLAQIRGCTIEEVLAEEEAEAEGIFQ
jgi:hypothetical protein